MASAYAKVLITLAVLLASPVCLSSTDRPEPQADSKVLQDFPFDDGSTLDLRQHYYTLGTPRRGDDGRVENAVLIMHGTTGSGDGFLSEHFAGVLFGEGQLLDASRYYIILPDAIGHGLSSKPSDGLRARFPKYTYDDMVRAQYRLLTEHLDVDHLRLVTGTSMGGMMSWVWGYTYPQFMDALLPLASLPVEIAGRNRMTRKMIIDAVTDDPAWKGGDYEEQPPGLKEAMYGLLFMVSSPLQYQLQAPTRESAETMMDTLVERYRSRIDANDLIYAFDASRFYNGVHINRVMPGYIAQFGLNPYPAVTAAWKAVTLTDDRAKASNTIGRVAFAMTGPDTRSTQVYINLGDNARLDEEGFAPFGEVVAGMDVVERLYPLYGNNAGGGMRHGRQGPLEQGGAHYVFTHYPLLDYIVNANVVGE